MNRHSFLTTLYYVLAMTGLVTTWYYNGQYLLNGGGLGPKEFFEAAFSNSLTTAITIDVYLCALVFSVWVISDAKRLSVKRPWLYVALCFTVGLAISLPVYLATREKAILKANANA